ncbi:hypothetical protein B566_EDAN016838 [Ephemera danica]|nr:hypothetical protein B566_EDAN016838 [Ephemera danica]
MFCAYTVNVMRHLRGRLHSTPCQLDLPTSAAAARCKGSWETTRSCPGSLRLARRHLSPSPHSPDAAAGNTSSPGRVAAKAAVSKSRHHKRHRSDPGSSVAQLTEVVAVALEVEPQLEDIVVELAAEPSLVRVFPLSINDFECNVFIGRASMETQHCKVSVKNYTNQEIFWSGILVNKVRIKNVKFVSLDNFGWRIVHVVVSLIVLVPFKTSSSNETCTKENSPIEVTRFSRSVLVRPEVNLAFKYRFHRELGFIAEHTLASFSLQGLLLSCDNILQEIINIYLSEQAFINCLQNLKSLMAYLNSCAKAKYLHASVPESLFIVLFTGDKSTRLQLSVSQVLGTVPSTLIVCKTLCEKQVSLLSFTFLSAKTQ